MVDTQNLREKGANVLQTRMTDKEAKRSVSLPSQNKKTQVLEMWRVFQGKSVLESVHKSQFVSSSIVRAKSVACAEVLQSLNE